MLTNGKQYKQYLFTIFKIKHKAAHQHSNHHHLSWFYSYIKKILKASIYTHKGEHRLNECNTKIVLLIFNYPGKRPKQVIQIKFKFTFS